MSRSGHSARSSGSFGKLEASPSKTRRRENAAHMVDQHQYDIFVSESSVWQAYLKKRSSARAGEGVSASRTVLHAGRGGAGRRNEAASCTGRHRMSKCGVRKSKDCRLCATVATMEFIIDGECIALSARSMLRIKGARVELVEPDGRHLWLWNVPRDALCSIEEAFARVQQAGAASGSHGDAKLAAGGPAREPSECDVDTSVGGSPARLTGRDILRCISQAQELKATNLDSTCSTHRSSSDAEPDRFARRADPQARQPRSAQEPDGGNRGRKGGRQSAILAASDVSISTSPGVASCRTPAVSPLRAHLFRRIDPAKTDSNQDNAGGEERAGGEGKVGGAWGRGSEMARGVGGVRRDQFHAP